MTGIAHAGPSDAIGHFVAAPEPANWAMMILGMGLTGMMLRNHHRRERRRAQAERLLSAARLEVIASRARRP